MCWYDRLRRRNAWFDLLILDCGVVLLWLFVGGCSLIGFCGACCFECLVLFCYLWFDSCLWVVVGGLDSCGLRLWFV